MALSLVTMHAFHGPDFGSNQWSVTLHSDNVPACTRVQPELACARRRAVAFAFYKVRAKHNLAHGCIDHVDAVVGTCNWRVDCFELLSSSPQDHERPQSCWGAVAHVPEPTLRSKDGSMNRGKLSRAAFVRESNQTRSLKSLSVRDKTKRSCTTVARLPPWCPHLQRKHQSKVSGPTVVTQEPQAGLQLPPAASAAVPVSLSLPLSVLLSECCLPTRQCWSR